MIFLTLQGEQQGTERIEAREQRQRRVRGDADAGRAPKALRCQGQGRLRGFPGLRAVRRLQHRLPQEHQDEHRGYVAEPQQQRARVNE